MTGEQSMSNIIDFNNYAEDEAVEIVRTEEFHKTAQALSDHIQSLPLSRAQNDELIQLIFAHVQAAQRGAISQGFMLGAGVNGSESGMMS